MFGLDESHDPRRMQEWNRDEVRSWLVRHADISEESADILWKNEINGDDLIATSDASLMNLGVNLSNSAKIKSRFMTLHKNWSAVSESK